MKNTKYKPLDKKERKARQENSTRAAWRIYDLMKEGATRSEIIEKLEAEGLTGGYGKPIRSYAQIRVALRVIGFTAELVKTWKIKKIKKS